MLCGVYVYTLMYYLLSDGYAFARGIVCVHSVHLLCRYYSLSNSLYITPLSFLTPLYIYISIYLSIYLSIYISISPTPCVLLALQREEEFQQLTASRLLDWLCMGLPESSLPLDFRSAYTQSTVHRATLDDFAGDLRRRRKVQQLLGWGFESSHSKHALSEVAGECVFAAAAYMLRRSTPACYPVQPEVGFVFSLSLSLSLSLFFFFFFFLRQQ
jgi:hypothetical protein